MEEAVAFSAESETNVLREHERRIGHLARRFRFDVDDLMQVGRIALLDAARKWQGKPHTSAFWTYARKAVWGEMLNYVTREIARAAVEAESGLEPASVCAPDAALEAREHIAGLPEREACIFVMHAAGHDVAEISALTSVSVPRVYHLLKDSMEKIRKHA